MKIAIVGKAGAGKTSVTELFDTEEYLVVYADAWVNSVYNDRTSKRSLSLLC